MIIVRVSGSGVPMDRANGLNQALGTRAERAGASVHFLQSCQHVGRVLDEHSTDTTAPQLWGRVSGGPPSDGPASGEPDATGARRPAWLVEHTTPAEPWKCASRLSRVE